MLETKNEITCLKKCDLVACYIPSKFQIDDVIQKHIILIKLSVSLAISKKNSYIEIFSLILLLLNLKSGPQNQLINIQVTLYYFEQKHHKTI